MTMTCFSSSAAPIAVEKPSSKVVMIDGTLREFSRYTTAKNVMEEDASNCIIFDIDNLHVGEHILPLKHDDELHPGHTYMLLPQSASHRRLDSVDMEELSMKVKEAVLVATVEEKFGRSSSFCGFKGMLSGRVIGEKKSSRKEKSEGEDVMESKGKTSKTGIVLISGEGKKAERKQSKSQYVWYLGFAILPMEEDY